MSIIYKEIKCYTDVYLFLRFTMSAHVDRLTYFNKVIHVDRPTYFNEVIRTVVMLLVN